MTAKIINGKQIANDINNEIKIETEKLKTEKGIIPGLVFIIVGDDPASQVYVRMKEKGCKEVGFFSTTEKLPINCSEKKLLELIEDYNHNSKIHGILVQLPLPKHICETKIINAIDYRKDVDGFHPINVGRLSLGQKCFKPCTPAAVQELLIRSGNPPAGKHIVIVGRSNVVGKPLANILMQKKDDANAIVTVVHSATKDIPFFTQQADILVVAIGQAEFIIGNMVRPGAVVIDVGINRIEDPLSRTGYRIVGDVNFRSVSQTASAITPVPGGVGPMTIAMLFRNTLLAAKNELFSNN